MLLYIWKSFGFKPTLWLAQFVPHKERYYDNLIETYQIPCRFEQNLVFLIGQLQVPVLLLLMVKTIILYAWHLYFNDHLSLQHQGTPMKSCQFEFFIYLFPWYFTLSSQIFHLYEDSQHFGWNKLRRWPGKPTTFCSLLADLSNYRRRESQHELDLNSHHIGERLQGHA